ncbi:glutathione-dependent formaldehyde-activating GFA [Diaporthe helianthi]|uniref:Glutathione-dependent formaldehyde-activating GFA n=1 Tax=Diaporthe helianthi TaxID=158607 RepID=A0A2P5HKT5_DIAHE|nr:glutathione-dependent formaldehyde-activating GFA [Diaporthe helianthi]
MSSTEELPKPPRVTGGCLCGAVRYRVDFPRDFEIAKNCRRNSGAIFWSCIQVPKACLRWAKAKDTTSNASRDEDWSSFESAPSTLRSYSATPGNGRGFCADCGGFLTWTKFEGSMVDFSVGTIDPLYLVGPSDDPEVGKTDVEGQDVPKGGYGAVLAGGYGRNVWCSNEIKGVTDRLVAVGVGRGQRSFQDG